jgi:hypothetical protein
MTISTPAPGWHADEQLLTRYLRGDAGAALGSSIEAHLVRCATCRGRIAPLVDQGPLHEVWARLEESAQAPRRSLLHRLVQRLGLPDHDALLLAAAPALRAGWLWGTALALAFAAAAGAEGGDRGAMLFLLVAPLAPVAGVAASYGPDLDEAYEATLAAPYSSARLLLLRSVAVLVTSVPVAGLGGLLLPGNAWAGVSWLTPAAAGVALTLAGSTWTTPARAAVVVAALWLVVVGTVLAPDGDAAVLTLLTGPALALYAATGLTAALVFRARSGQLALMGRNA